MKIQKLISQKTQQEEQVLEAETLLQAIDEKVQTFSDNMKVEARDELLNIRERNAKQYQDLFEPIPS